MNLNKETLSLLDPKVEIPEYPRALLRSGIVHVGVGGFHRSHQALYTDDLIGKLGIYDWAICGAGLLEQDRLMGRDLKGQDYLYTLLVSHPDGTFTARVIGSIIDYIFAPDNPDLLIERMAHPSTKIVSLTITEGGYNYNQATGEFETENKDTLWDLRNPHMPRTLFGFLSESLKRRKERGIPAFTVMSCDNLQHNGDMAKRMLLAFTDLKDPFLSEWIERNTAFPNSMVDRITPAATETVVLTLQSEFGFNDTRPVVCEPFCQWIIEDNFSSGRPQWESTGVQFVPDVSPFEKMKIRLLNAGHSLLGFSGALHGYTFIHEVVHDKLFAKFLRDFMDKEVTPVLDEVPGIDLDSYKVTLFERFGNSHIRDSVSRICLQSSSKIPKFLLPTIRDQLKAGGPVDRSAFVIAAWCRYSEGFDESGNKYTIDDDMGAVLTEMAIRSRHDPLAFLRIEPVFGDLVYSHEFTNAYTKALQQLYQKGVKECINEMYYRQD